MPSFLSASAFYLSTQISCRGSVMWFLATAPFTFLFIELTEILPFKMSSQSRAWAGNIGES